MASRLSPPPLVRLSLVGLSLLAAAPGCQDSSTVYALIGPEGGEVSLPEGPTLKIPPGALVATRQIVIRPIEDDLSRGSFKQSGGAYRIEPTDLDLNIPGELTFAGDQPKQPTVLWRRGEGRVVAHAADEKRALAYIGALGVVALAAGGERSGAVDEPVLVVDPAAADYTKAFVDTATIKVTPKGTPTIDVGFTVYDPMGMSNRPLNGEGSRYCGFKFGMVQGGSITAGCSGNLATGSITVNSTQVSVDAQPFLLGKLDNPVLVEVQVGSGELAHSLGYFTFETSPCYLESCSGHGMCDSSSGSPVCTCDDGYKAGEGLTCDCVPQCDGRQCAGDSCGGQCGYCGPDAECDYNTGQCNGLPPPDTTTTDPSTTSTTDASTSSSSSTDASSTSTSGGSSGGSSGSST